MIRHWIVVGNPENRRVTQFVAAVERAGQSADVVAWRDVALRPDALLALPDVPAWLRLESAGEDDAVQHALYVRGGGDPTRRLAHGELFAPAAHHRGFLAVLNDVRAVLAERPAWVPITPLDAIARAFDKAAFHARCADLGVPTAPALAGVGSFDDLLAALGEARCVFVKLRHGSSAVGIGVFTPDPPRLMTTIRVTPDGWFNSLRMQRVTDVGRIRTIVDGLCAEGVHVEVGVPKATLGRAFFDLRIVAIAGEPVFTVVRCSRHVVTNLHLGGWRGDLGALRARCPQDVWSGIEASVRTVARDHGGLHVGLDVLIERGWGGHRVLEANAFGDLLPGLVDAQGRSVYEAEVAAATCSGGC